MSVLERESVSRHLCANLGAHGWEAESPVASPAVRLRSPVCQAPGEEEAWNPPRSPASCGSRLRSRAHGEASSGGLGLALPGLRALEKAALPSCLPHSPLPAALGRGGQDVSPSPDTFTKNLSPGVLRRGHKQLSRRTGLGLFGERRKGNGT